MIELPKDKFILDACCGGRMMWVNKQHPNAVYMDIRIAEPGHDGYSNHSVKPDIIGDFSKTDFKDKQFKLIVWDPPHIIASEARIHLTKQYGILKPETWQHDLKQGFKELWRILDDNGILIFKFNSINVPFDSVLRLFPVEPLFGQTSVQKKNAETKWFCFMKIPEKEVRKCYH